MNPETAWAIKSLGLAPRRYSRQRCDWSALHD